MRSVPSSSLYDLAVRTIDGSMQSMADYRGQVLLIVNVASRCGYTPQYAGLESLYRRYQDRGFRVLGFPCNQFGAQEPGSEAEIAAFCASTYDVTFPMFAKIDVNGAATDPLYAYLKARRPGLLGMGRIKWNFTKFLVGADGEVLRRYAPYVAPEKIERDVAAALTRSAPRISGDAPPRTSRSR